MSIRITKWVAVSALMLSVQVGVTTPARAGIPVVDTAEIAASLQQLQSWIMQYYQMYQQINQLRAAYNAITGGRGMDAVLPVTMVARNYLPPDKAALMNAVGGMSVMYPAMSAQIQAIKNTNAVMNPGQLLSLTSQAQSIVQTARSTGAMLESIASETQRMQTQRFSDLDTLRTTIGFAPDQKAIQDLQARIAAEQTQISSDQIKTEAMYQLAHARELQREQMVRESSATMFGSSSTMRHMVFP